VGADAEMQSYKSLIDGAILFVLSVISTALGAAAASFNFFFFLPIDELSLIIKSYLELV
jgi:hypothetical protein